MTLARLVPEIQGGGGFRGVPPKVEHSRISGRGHFHGLPLRLFLCFSLSSRNRTPERKSTTSVRYLVVINQPFYIAVRNNDFTVITVPRFNVCLR